MFDQIRASTGEARAEDHLDGSRQWFVAWTTPACELDRWRDGGVERRLHTAASFFLPRRSSYVLQKISYFENIYIVYGIAHFTHLLSLCFPPDMQSQPLKMMFL
jgi:hypothetical protein